MNASPNNAVVINISKQNASSFFTHGDSLVQEVQNYLIYISQNRDLSISFNVFRLITSEQLTDEILFEPTLINVSIRCPDRTIQKHSSFIITPSHPIVITFLDMEINYFISKAKYSTEFIIAINKSPKTTQNYFCSFIYSLILFSMKFNIFVFSPLIHNQIKECNFSFPSENSEEMCNFYTSLINIYRKRINSDKMANFPLKFSDTPEMQNANSDSICQLLGLMFSSNDIKIDCSTDKIVVRSKNPQDNHNLQLMAWCSEIGFMPFFKAPEGFTIEIYIEKQLLEEKDIIFANEIQLNDQNPQTLIEFDDPFKNSNTGIQKVTIYELLKAQNRLHAFMKNEPKTIESDAFPFYFDINQTVFVSIPKEKKISMECKTNNNLKIELFDISNDNDFEYRDNYFFVCADGKQTFFKIQKPENLDPHDISSIYCIFEYHKNSDRSLTIQSLPTFVFNDQPNNVTVTQTIRLTFFNRILLFNWCITLK